MKAQQALGPAFIGAIGVVFGDIGTSPLYAFKESLGAAGFQPGDASTVLGLLSLIFWTLAIVVSVKYLAVIMRADNHGEGGILSLVALVQQRFGTRGALGAPRGGARRAGRGAVLLRCADHAGHLRAERRRRPGDPESRIFRAPSFR